MTTATVSVATASRDPEVLKEVGRFGLRTLAMELGMFDDANYKVAFQGMNAGDQAQAVATKLIEKDGGKPKGAKAAGKATTTPPRTPVTGSKASSTKQDAEPSAESAGVNAAKLLEAFQELNSNYAALLEEVQAHRAETQALQNNVSGTNTLVCLGVSLALQMSEEVLKAPPAQVLAAAIDQMGDIMPQLEELISSQAGGPPDDDDQGNG